ncbi:MAG: hypothetical protein MUC87_20665 [Bacteroidia bacterium]|nr:hypothetical protein [Bacteroidia bacterium]
MMTSIDIKTKEYSGNVLRLYLNFEEELTNSFLELLYREMISKVSATHQGLLIDIQDLILLNLNNEVIQELVQKSSLSQFHKGVAVSSRSRITRQILNEAFLRSRSNVPIKVFSDCDTALEWLTNRNTLLQ